MANQLRDTIREQQWRQHIRAWQSSGLSIRAYCLRHQLSEPSFYAWRRELSRRDEVVSVEPVHRVQSSVTWMPVTVTPSPAAVVEVRLPTGTVLRVPAEVESLVWERILSALFQVNASPLHQTKTPAVLHQAKALQEQQP